MVEYFGPRVLVLDGQSVSVDTDQSSADLTNVKDLQRRVDFDCGALIWCRIYTGCLIDRLDCGTFAKKRRS